MTSWFVYSEEKLSAKHFIGNIGKSAGIDKLEKYLKKYLIHSRDFKRYSESKAMLVTLTDILVIITRLFLTKNR